MWGDTMKRIVICLDGTWNQVRNPKTVTNVVRLAQSVAPCAANGTQQICYYNSGVGTGDPIDRVLGGVFGRGIRANVKRAYTFLSLNYQPGDEIYIFGFSRGAYTARALAGMIGASGLLKKEFLDLLDVDVAWNHYRTRPSQRSQPGAPKHPGLDRVHQGARLRCVGVWDTVGSYGVPAGFGLGALMRYYTSWQRGFHDTHVNRSVDISLQALAVDERRRPFAPTFWTAPAGTHVENHVEQVWFCGAHSNVGGGYQDATLAAFRLIWMVARVTRLTGLAFDTAIVKQYTLNASASGLLNKSNRWWPVSRIWPFRRPVEADEKTYQRLARWNNWPLDERPVNETVHWSVQLRLREGGRVEDHRHEGYHPSNLRRSLQFSTITEEEVNLLPPSVMKTFPT